MNSVTAISAPDQGGAIRFSDVDGEAVTIAHDAGLNAPDYTVEAWITTSDADNESNRVISKPVGSNQTYSLVIRNGILTADTTAFDSTTATSGVFVADGQPHHIAVSYDSTALVGKLYVDGVLVATFPATNPLPQSTEDVIIGDYPAPFDQAFDGDISEVRIWSDVRTDQEVLDNFDQPLAPGEPNLEAYLTFDGDALDQSGNGRDGTIVGAPVFVSAATPVDAPLQTEEDVALAVSNIAISDLDAGNVATLTLSVASGTLTLGTIAGLTFEAGANGSATFTVKGSVADINAALATLSYLGDLDFNGADAIDISVTDNGAVETSNASGALSIPNAGFFFIYDFDTGTASSEARSGGSTPPSGGPDNGVFIQVNPNNAEWVVQAVIVENGVQTIADPANFSIAGYGGASFVNGDFFQINDVTSNATLTFSQIAPTPEGDRPVTFTFTGVDFADAPPGVVNIDSADVTLGLSDTGLSEIDDISGPATAPEAGLFFIYDFDTGVGTTELRTGGITDVTAKPVNGIYVEINPNQDQFNVRAHIVENGVDILGDLFGFDIPGYTGGTSSSAINFQFLDSVTNGTMTFTQVVPTPGGEREVVVTFNGVDFIDNGAGELDVESATITLGATATQSVEINVASVSDAPFIIAPADATGDEDVAIAVAGLSVGDADADPATEIVEVGLSVANGIISFADLTGLTVNAGGNDTAAISVLGTIDDVNAALATLSYLGDPDFNGADQINVTVAEVSNPGSGGPQTAAATIPITVNAVADDPFLDLGGGFPEVGPAPAVVSASGANPDIAALEGGGFVVVYRDGFDAFAQRYDDDGVVVGGPVQINTQFGSATGHAIGSLAVDGLPGGGFTVSYAASDSNDSFFNEGILSQNFDAGGVKVGAEQFTAVGNNFSGLNTVAALSGGGHVAVYRDSFDGGNFEVFAQLYDAAGSKAGAPILLGGADPAAPNNPSVTGLSGGGFAVTWVEDSGNVVSVNTYDASGTQTSGPVLLTGAQFGPVAAVDARPDGGFVVAFTGPGADSFVQLFDAAGAAVGSPVGYGNSGGSFFPAQDVTVFADGSFLASQRATLTGAVNDGAGVSTVGQYFDAGGAPSGDAFVLNASTASNELGPSEKSLVTLENGSVAFLYFQNNTAGNLFAQVLPASAPVADEDVPIALPIAATSVDVGAELTLFLSGFPPGGTFNLGAPDGANWTIANAEALDLSTLVFTPPQDFNGSFTLTVQADSFDPASGGVTSVTDTLSVTVNALNDAPVITAGGAVVGDEDTSIAIVGVSVADADAGEGSGEITVSLSVPLGALTLGATAGLVFDAGANGTGAFTVRGLVTDVNAALATLAFLGPQDFNGDVQLDIAVDDLGNAGAGAPGVANGAVTITVSPVNDAPVAADDAFTLGEDDTVVFSAIADNGAGQDTDVDLDPLGVSAIGGEAVSQGSRVTLTSGAVVTIGANGTFTYQAAGAFDLLNEGDQATDSFIYTISDGAGGTDQATATFTVTGANELFEGTRATDLLTGTAANDVVRAGGGADLISGGLGSDTVRAGDGDDIGRGGGGDDMLLGGGGADRMFGEEGSDTLDGGAGADSLFGFSGRDVLIGKGGDDLLNGGGGADVLRGGNGRDVINGGGAGDKLFGGSARDVLIGKNGADLLAGEGGADRLIGGGGADTLIGGAGNDTLTGGGGADVFVFRGEKGRDLVRDFVSGTDQIKVEGGLTASDVTIVDGARGAEVRIGDSVILFEGADVELSDFVF